MGGLTSAPWQCDLDGLLIGPGTPYEIRSLTGVVGQPPLRTNDQARARQHGSFGDVDFAAPKVVEVQVDIVATAAVRFDDAVQAWEDTTSVPYTGDRPFWVQLPSRAPRRLDVRVRASTLDLDQAYQFGIAAPALQLVALDPRAFGDTRSQSTALATSGGGLVYPLTYPLTYGVVSTSGRVEVTNDGNAEASPRFVVTGPVPGFEIAVLETGQRLVYGGPLAAGQLVVLDSADGSVLLDGATDRSASLTVADWPVIPPRSSLTFNLASLGSYDPGVLMQVLVEDTWW